MVTHWVAPPKQSVDTDAMHTCAYMPGETVSVARQYDVELIAPCEDAYIKAAFQEEHFLL